MNIANRSKQYVFTVDPSNIKQREIFDELRLIVQIYNRVEGTKFRLKRLGRLGKNNPATLLYRNRVDGRSYQGIRVADAGYFDIYINDRTPGYVSGAWEEQCKLAATLRSWAKLASAN